MLVLAWSITYISQIELIDSKNVIDDLPEATISNNDYFAAIKPLRFMPFSKDHILERNYFHSLLGNFMYLYVYFM